MLMHSAPSFSAQGQEYAWDFFFPVAKWQQTNHSCTPRRSVCATVNSCRKRKQLVNAIVFHIPAWSRGIYCCKSGRITSNTICIWIIIKWFKCSNNEIAFSRPSTSSYSCDLARHAICRSTIWCCWWEQPCKHSRSGSLNISSGNDVIDWFNCFG